MSTVLDVSGSLSLSVPLGLTESFAFNGVPPGTYTLSVRSINAFGAASPSSNPVTLSFPGACSGAPETPANFVAYRVGHTIFVSWDTPAAGAAPTAYVVSVTGSFTGSVPTSGAFRERDGGPGTYSLTVAAIEPMRYGAGVSAARRAGAVRDRFQFTLSGHPSQLLVEPLARDRHQQA